MGFRSAELPQPAPLQHSHEASQIEGELKSLFADLFELVAPETFDISVIGAPHLGSMDLVRRMITHDGLVLMRGDHEEAAVRYLYRAWRSGDVQKRGLHFARLYLQALFPGEAVIRQIWHDKRFPYGQAFVDPEAERNWINYLGEPGLRIDGSWQVGRLLGAGTISATGRLPNIDHLVLTSRVEIALPLDRIAAEDVAVGGVRRPTSRGLLEAVRAILPARLVPIFRFWLRLAISAIPITSAALAMSKRVEIALPDGVTASHQGLFKIEDAIGVRLAKLPLDAVVKLRRWRYRLDGSWTLGALSKMGGFALDGSTQLRSRKMTHARPLGSFRISPDEYQFAGLEDLGLGPTRRLPLNGSWRVGSAAPPEFSMTVTRI
jgi:hypothetical protein